MLLLLLALTYIVGLIFGSFLNVVADRSINGESILFGRSHCESCRHTLKSKDLVPLLSFFSTKGTCRYCKSKLSLAYPTSEMLTGVAFLGAAVFSRVFTNFSTQTFISFVFMLSALCFYIVLFLTDAKYRLIPNKVVFFGMAFIFVFLVAKIVFDYANMRYVLSIDGFGKYLLEAGYAETQLGYAVKKLVLTVVSSFGIAGFFIFLIKITRGRGMGGGDVTLGFLIGLVNGFPNNMVAIFMGFVLGAVYSVALLVVGQKSLKDTIPFGPFLILGSVVVYVWGDALLKWYFGLF